jgi:hypothetical protein
LAARDGSGGSSATAEPAVSQPTSTSAADNANLAALSASTSPASAFMERARALGNDRASAADASIAVEAAARCGRALVGEPPLCKDCTHYVSPTSAHIAFYGGPVYVVPMCGHPRAQRDVVVGELATTAQQARYGAGIGEPLCGVDARLFERRAATPPESLKPGSIIYVPPPVPSPSVWERVKGWFI